MPHLEGAVPSAGQGKRISTYNIALEGWRRGLSLTFYGSIEDKNELKIKYSLSNNERTHYFSLSMGDKVTNEAFNICQDKEQTKKYLSAKNVPVPEGGVFGPKDNDKDICKFAKSLGFPLVLKPVDSNAGNGVFANIQNIDEFKELLIHVKEELGFKHIIVEKYIEGAEYRIFVIEDKVTGAIKRRPASIVGDGKKTVYKLIENINKIRKSNPHLTNRLIKVDREVKNSLAVYGYNLDSIPEKGKRVFLRDKSNLSKGGDAIDVTDNLTNKLKEIAISAGKAIPGLTHYGVDMIIDPNGNMGTILEVNARPGIGGHLFPMEGQPRDLAKEIINYYFPETINIERSNLYFDFDSIVESLTSRAAECIKIGNCTSTGQLFGKKFIISGKVQKVGYRKWITRKARERNLNGYTKNLKNGKVVVLVAGPEEHIVNDFKDLCYQGPPKAIVHSIKEKEWKKPLEIGFEIRTTHKEQLKMLKSNEDILNNLKQENKKLQSDLKNLYNEKLKFEKKYQQTINSRSWKLTYPLRYISTILRNKTKHK